MWIYTLADFDPVAGVEEDEWAGRWAAEGWRTWHPSGTWVEINGRRVRRWSLRREVPKCTSSPSPNAAR